MILRLRFFWAQNPLKHMQEMKKILNFASSINGFGEQKTSDNNNI